MKKNILKVLGTSLCLILFAGCGDPKIDTSTLGKYQDSTIEVRKSLPLDKVNIFDEALISLSVENISDINGKTGLEVIDFYYQKQKDYEKYVEEENLKNIKKQQEIQKELIFKYDDTFNLNIADSRDNPKILELGITIKSNVDIKQLYENNRGFIINKIEELIKNSSSEELSTLGGKNLLKDDINECISDILNSMKNKDGKQIIVRILYTNFLIR